MFSRPTAPEEGQEPEAPSTSGRARGAAPRLADDASVPAQRPYAKAEPGVARVFLARELSDALLFLAGAGDAAGDAAAGPKVKAHFKRYFPNTHYRDCVKVVAELREDERTWEGGRCAARPRLHGPRLQPAGTCGRARRAPEPPAPELNPAPAGTTTRTTTGRCCARAGPRRAGTADYPYLNALIAQVWPEFVRRALEGGAAAKAWRAAGLFPLRGPGEVFRTTEQVLAMRASGVFVPFPAAPPAGAPQGGGPPFSRGPPQSADGPPPRRRRGVGRRGGGGVS